MADRSLRGIRLGAQSLQSEEGVVFHDRAQHTVSLCSRTAEVIGSVVVRRPSVKALITCIISMNCMSPWPASAL